MEDVQEMKSKGVVDHTLVWVDSALREQGGSDSSYSVKLVEPLRNVVGIRIIEATIPATMMSIESGNDKMVLHTVGYSDEVPTTPSTILRLHTASADGQAWRVHDSTLKSTAFDIGHNTEHHVTSQVVNVFQIDVAYVDELLQAPQPDPGTYVACAIQGDQRRLLHGASSPVVYDIATQTTVVACSVTANMQYAGMCTLVAGVYHLPHGKYDSLRDLIYELKHAYATSKDGVMLTFIEPQTDKPERSFKMQINPSKVWSSVLVEGESYSHQYLIDSNFWCAVQFDASNCLATLGMSNNVPTLQTEGGRFLESHPHPRYSGRLRGETLINLASERYVWLRCEEVEQHMCAGIGKVMQKGIGVFRLDAPGVFKEEKTEYISVIPNQFHPISRLSRLTFRFDMGSKPGTQYDFRNVGHYMLVSVSTLKPDRENVYAHLPRILNPEYEPNALKYQLRQVERTQNHSTRALALTKEEEAKVLDTHNATMRNAPISHAFSLAL